MWGWHIDAISEHLEAVTGGEITRLLINVPPGMMKSLSCGVFWPAWEWGPMGMPHLRFIGTSYKDTLATRDNLRMRRLIQSDWYQERWPLELTGDQNAKLKFENVASGWRAAAAFRSMTGDRGDRVLVDDPLSVSQALSDVVRDDVNDIFRQSLTSRLNNADRSAIVVIMQRLHENDPAGMIIAKNFGYEHLMLPMEFVPSRKCYTSIGFEDPRTEEGELLFPERFSRESVERDKTIMTPYAVAGQYQQDPIPRNDQGYFKREWIKDLLKAPEPGDPTIRVYGASDYAVSDGKGDYTVHILVGIDTEGRLIVLDVWRAKTSSDVWVETFCDLVLKWKPLQWAEESGQIKSGVGPFLKRRMRERHAAVYRETFPTKGDKAIRAQSIRGRIAMEGLHVPVDAPWRSDFIDELVRFGATAIHDDQVDALGLIGQMLDVINPAKRLTEKPTESDRWDKAFSREEDTAENWKTA